MSAVIELKVGSRQHSLDRVRSITRMSFDDEAIAHVDLAVREALINAIKHGNRNLESMQVDVTFAIEADRFTVYIRDRGPGFEPSRVPDPRHSNHSLRPSGRGIFLMRSFMDEVEYSTHPDGGSIVRMSKYKPRQQAQQT